MKLIPRKPKLVTNNTPAPQKKDTTPSREPRNKLPADSYKDEIKPVHVDCDENRHIIISVKRGGEDGLPMLDIRWFQTTDLYTGYTKKGISIPLELMTEIVSALQDAIDESAHLLDE